MKRDMNIMESVNNPFVPCFRAAHTLATPLPTSQTPFAVLCTK